MQARMASIIVVALLAGWLPGCIPPAAGNVCTKADECPDGQECLTEFKGGYCGTKGCTRPEDCPDDTICVTYEGANYCFLRCVDKADCNVNRPVEQEANCVSSIVAVGSDGSKACVPPMGS
jgi:hypothetical protein